MSAATYLILCAARMLVERGWCKGFEARNSIDEPTYPGDDDARAWCVLGALARAKIDLGISYEEWRDARDAFIRANALDLDEVYPPNDVIARWNDRRDGVGEVVEAFTKAIALYQVAQ